MLISLQYLMHVSDPGELLGLDVSKLQGLPYHLYSKDKNGKYFGCNDEQALTVGLKTGSEILGCTDFDLCWQHYAPNLQKNDQEVIHVGAPKMFIEPATAADGSAILLFSYKMPLYAANKKARGIVGVSLWVKKEDVANKMVSLSSQLQILPTEQLTQRQLDCLYYLVKGMTIKRIASALKLSPKTIEHYLDAIKLKLKCRSRAELIAKALQIKSISDKL